MSKAQVVATRNLFVNTEETIVGNCRDTTINLPQNLFSCNENQIMRLTLGSFSMKQNWYSVNENNNKFYFVSHDGAGTVSSVLVEIPLGDYQSFSDEEFGLCHQISLALNVSLNQAPYLIPTSNTQLVTHNSFTNQITIEIVSSGAAPGGVTIAAQKIVSFTLPDYSPSWTGIIPGIIGHNFVSAFQDNWQIMGGCKHDKKIDDSTGTDTQQFDALTSMFGGTGAVHKGYWRASLATEENLYVRTDLNGSNFQTAGYDANSSLFPYVVGSQILGKIPISNENTDYVFEKDPAGARVGRYIYEKPYKLIEFMDNGENLFSIMLPQKHVAQLRIHLTDAYGRPIPIGAEQLKCSGSPFTATIRCDVME